MEGDLRVPSRHARIRGMTTRSEGWTPVSEAGRCRFESCRGRPPGSSCPTYRVRVQQAQPSRSGALTVSCWHGESSQDLQAARSKDQRSVVCPHRPTERAPGYEPGDIGSSPFGDARWRVSSVVEHRSHKPATQVRFQHTLPTDGPQGGRRRHMATRRVRVSHHPPRLGEASNPLAS